MDGRRKEEKRGEGVNPKQTKEKNQKHKNIKKATKLTYCGIHREIKKNQVKKKKEKQRKLL